MTGSSRPSTTTGPAASRPGRRAGAREFIAANQWVLLLGLTLLLGVMTGLINPRFFDSRNIISILEQSAVLGLVAAGATLLIISGNFDISVGAMIGLSAVTMAMLVLRGVPEPIAMVVGLSVPVACSIVNAVVSRVFQAPTFIVSLATAGIFTGIALALTEGIIQQVPEHFTFFSSTRLFGTVPLVWIVSLGGYIAVGAILRYTRIGRRTYAIGDNPRAAFHAGIDVSRSVVALFAINGLLVGIAAVMLISGSVPRCHRRDPGSSSGRSAPSSSAACRSPAARGGSWARSSACFSWGSSRTCSTCCASTHSCRRSRSVD